MLTVPINSTDHIQGAERAAVTLVEYGDYQCSYCGAAYPTIKAVQRHFGDRLAYVFRQFPLTEIHPLAEAAAETAEFAGAGGRFWDMHDGLYENQDRLGLPLFFALAEALDLSPEDLREAIENRRYAGKIQDDFRGGVASGVQGTPSFFINGRKHEGAYDVPHLLAAIEATEPRA